MCAAQLEALIKRPRSQAPCVCYATVHVGNCRLQGEGECFGSVTRGHILFRAHQLSKTQSALLQLLASEHSTTLAEQLEAAVLSSVAQSSRARNATWTASESADPSNEEGDAISKAARSTAKAQQCLRCAGRACGLWMSVDECHPCWAAAHVLVVCRKILRPLMPSTCVLLQWIPLRTLCSEGSERAHLGELYCSIHLLLCDFHSKVCEAVSAAKRPVGLRSAKPAEETVSQESMLEVAGTVMGSLRAVLCSAWEHHGCLLAGDASDQDPTSVWAAFQDPDPVDSDQTTVICSSRLMLIEDLRPVGQCI